MEMPSGLKIAEGRSEVVVGASEEEAASATEVVAGVGVGLATEEAEVVVVDLATEGAEVVAVGSATGVAEEVVVGSETGMVADEDVDLVAEDLGVETVVEGVGSKNVILLAPQTTRKLLLMNEGFTGLLG